MVNSDIMPSIMRSLSSLMFWFLRAWPVLAFVPISCVHAGAHQLFPDDTIIVNKIIGTMLQVVGGLLILYSVNANLSLFRDKYLGSIVMGWIKSFPLFRKSVTVSLSGSSSVATSGNVRISVRRGANTVEEKIAELERQLDEFRQHINEDIQAINARIEQVHTELSKADTTNTAILSHLSSKLELATVGGFKQQVFGVFLAVYGAVTSVFA